jgi:hypothetical protein
MTKSFVINKTYRRIAEGLKDQGFEYKKSNERILKKITGGFYGITLHIVDYRPIFQIEIYLGIRIDAVEEIVNRFLEYTFASPEFMKFTETIGTTYKVLNGSLENHIEIKSETELENGIDILIKTILSKGFEFFAQKSNQETLNSLKKEQILKDNMGSFSVDRNLMQSLTLMKLCNDPDFDKLKDKYKELYVPFAGEEISGRKALNDLIEYLQGYNPEKKSQA